MCCNPSKTYCKLTNSKHHPEDLKQMDKNTEKPTRLAIVLVFIVRSLFIASVLAFIIWFFWPSSSRNDITEFQKFSDLDKAGEIIDCSALINTRIIGKSNPFSASEPEERDVLDYIKRTGYSFTQCRPQIDNFAAQYCATYLDSALKEFDGSKFSQSRAPSEYFLQFCTPQFVSAIAGLNDTYTVPASTKGFFVLEHQATMVRPDQIKKITFEEAIPGSLWLLTLQIEPNTYTLRFTDRKLFEQAKSDFSKGYD